MTIQDILSDINAQKTDAVNDLNSQLEAKIAELDKELEKQKEALEADYKERVAKKKESIERKMVAQTNMDKKALILNTKREMLENAFNNAVSELANSKDYTDFLASMLKNTQLKDAHVVYAKGKKSETEAALKKARKDYKISSEGDFTGGVLLQGKEVEIDLTFKTLVNDLRSELETEVSQKLF